MQQKVADVSMRVGEETKVVGQASFPEYDSVAEAVGDCGEDKILEMVNSQVRTNAMNRRRVEIREGPGKKAIQEKAVAAITDSEWVEIAALPAADRPGFLQRLIESKAAKLRSEYAASQVEETQTAGAPA